MPQNPGMSRAKSKARVPRPKSRKPIVRDYPDLLAPPPKKPPAPSVHQRQKLSRRRSG